MRARFAVGICAILAAGPTQAEAPLSAIDWLSDSIAGPSLSQDGQSEPGSDIADTATPGDISVTPLSELTPKPVGVLPPGEAGLPADIWSGSDVADVVRAMAAVPNDLPASLQDLFVRSLLIAAAPGSGQTDAFVTARVDRLLQLAELPDARALLEAAGNETAPQFRRYFDISLLLGTENQACALLRENPDISPTYPARIFCLARGGDWNAAAVTLETAETLGILTAEEDALLARFLDQDILVELPEDGSPLENTPLTFRLLEAVGEPLPTGTLPLAFAHADLSSNRGWKAQIDAAERLARSHALDNTTLFDLYRLRKPSASGGAWERARSVQELDLALSEKNRRKIADALEFARDEFRAAGLTSALAQEFGTRLVTVPLSGAAAGIRDDLALLSEAAPEIGRRMVALAPERQLLSLIAQGQTEDLPAYDMRSVAVRAGFSGDRQISPRLANLMADGRKGEALLAAITLFAQGAGGDPDGISDAISVFRSLELEDVARRASIDLLLAEPGL